MHQTAWRPARRKASPFVSELPYAIIEAQLPHATLSCNVQPLTVERAAKPIAARMMRSSRHQSTTSREIVRTHHWSDWAGVACFTALAALLWRRSPEFGIAVLPILCYELVVASSFLLRGPPRRTARGVLPRAVAYAHSFLPMVFLELTGRFRPEWLAPAADPVAKGVGVALWLIGVSVGFWPLWHLRRAFSIEPEARVLVTSGPYRWARHPIYAMYLLINAGLWLRHPSLPFAIVLLGWLGLLLLRVRAEERVLTEAFPEYAAYRRRVGAFGPKPAALLRAREA